MGIERWEDGKGFSGGLGRRSAWRVGYQYLAGTEVVKFSLSLRNRSYPLWTFLP